MNKHIVERAIVPHNPSASSIINKEKYNLYAPMVRRGQPGIAAFNPEQFIISDNVVSLNGNLIDMVNGTGEGAVQQIPDGVAGGFEFNSDKNPNAVEFDPSLNDILDYGATGNYAASFGGKSAAMGKRSHSEGTTTIAKGAYSHAEGDNAVALGDDSHAEGYKTTAYGEGSHAEGNSTVSEGKYSHAEGWHTTSEGEHSHAEGGSSIAKGEGSHAEGKSNTAQGIASHAEGIGNVVEGKYAHAEGSYNKVYATSAHAEGLENTIDEGAEGAHTSGRGNHAKHAGAQLLGKGLVSGRQNQTVVGQYNEYDDDAMFIVAAGEKYEPRNILVVRPDGTVEFEGKYYDHMVTDRLELRNISSKKGRVLVKGVALTAEDSGSVYAVPSGVILLEFSDCNMEDNHHTLRFNGHSNCTIKGLDFKAETCDIRINGFGVVENCDVSSDEYGCIENCSNVTGCSASYIRNCTYVSNCSMSSYYDSVISDCKYVCSISQYDFNNNNTTKITCENCSFVSNVDADGIYINCKYVDPDTCRGFVKPEDDGKVQILKADGAFATSEFVTPTQLDNFAKKTEVESKADKVYVDEKIGDIEYVLGQFGVVTPQEFAETTNIVPIPARANKYAYLKLLGGMTYKSKNLIPFPYEDSTKTMAGITFAVQEDGSIKVSGTSTGFASFTLANAENVKLQHGQTYKFTGAASDVIAIMAYDDSDGTRQYVTGNASDLLVWNEGYTLVQIYIQIYEGKTVNETIYPMLNIGTTALPYEPYYEGLQDTKVTAVKVLGADGTERARRELPASITSLDGWGKGIEGCANTYDFENGTYTMKSKSHTFTGDETWNYASVDTLKDYWRFYVLKAVYVPEFYTDTKPNMMLCNMFDAKAWESQASQNLAAEFMWYANSSVGVRIHKTRLPNYESLTNDASKINAFKEWLKNNTLTVTGVLTEPITEKISTDFDPLMRVEGGGSLKLVTTTGKPAPVAVEFQIILNQGGIQ